MGVLADWQIEAEGIVEPFIDTRKSPAASGTITYGVGHYGYDVRCSDEFQIFRPVYGVGNIIDPKNFNPELLEPSQKSNRYILDGAVVIPPNSFALTQTIERLNIPRGVLATVLGKSTYARCGIICNVTPLEPEWRGRITIEISNTTPVPAKIYPREGIAQVLFHRADGYTQVVLDELVEHLTELYLAAGMTADRGYSKEAARKQAEAEVTKRLRDKMCQISYADKKGRYQDQGDKVVLPCASGRVPVQADGQQGTGY